jgi:Leucine rich repeat
MQMLKNYLDGVNVIKKPSLQKCILMGKITILIFLIFISSCTKKEVEVIDLTGLNLTQIPDSVFTKKELKELYLGTEDLVLYPPLSALPQSRGKSNNLTELDNRICQLKSLKILNLAANQLKKLPICITELKNLEELDLSLNQDMNIVGEISRLKELPKLKILKIVDVQSKEQEDIVKRALEPRVHIITNIEEYFQLDSLIMKTKINSVVKTLAPK